MQEEKKFRWVHSASGKVVRAENEKKAIKKFMQTYKLAVTLEDISKKDE